MNRAERISDEPEGFDPTLSFVRRELVNALAVWREKSIGWGIPSRSDMNARALKPFLPNVVIVDIVREGEKRRYRTRLVGDAVARVFGNHTGKFIDEAYPSPFREQWPLALDAVISANGPLRLVGRAEYENQTWRTVEALMAPIGLCDNAAEAVLMIVYV